MIHYISDRIAVMYLGHIVEEGDKEALFETPKHPYTHDPAPAESVTTTISGMVISGGPQVQATISLTTRLVMAEIR